MTYDFDFRSFDTDTDAREGVIAYWDAVIADTHEALRLVIDNALAAGKRGDDPTVAPTLAMFRAMLAEAEDNRHTSNVMRFSTRKMLATKAAEKAAIAAKDDDSCPFCINGYIREFAHVANGICFRCDGRG